MFYGNEIVGQFRLPEVDAASLRVLEAEVYLKP